MENLEQRAQTREELIRLKEQRDLEIQQGEEIYKKGANSAKKLLVGGIGLSLATCLSPLVFDIEIKTNLQEAVFSGSFFTGLLLSIGGLYKEMINGLNKNASVYKIERGYQRERNKLIDDYFEISDI